MKKVTSTKTITFPKFRWGINKGEERELPEDKEAQEAILANPVIKEIGGEKKEEPKKEEPKKEETKK